VGVLIEDDAVVTVEFDDYFGGEVSVKCTLPTTKQHDAFQNAYMTVNSTNTSAAHREVVKLITHVDGIDMRTDAGDRVAITTVGPAEAKYLVDKHGRLLRSLADHLFGSTASEVTGDPLE